METKINILKQTFKLNGEIKPLSKTIGDGDLFKTEDSIIYLIFELNNFTVKELTNYTILAEELYEEYGKWVNICILLPNVFEIKVKELGIKSEAIFSIRLAVINMNPAYPVLDIIKAKYEQGIKLTEQEISFLEILPLYCDINDRQRFREDCLNILNNI